MINKRISTFYYINQPSHTRYLAQNFVFDMDSSIDYRMRSSTTNSLYFTDSDSISKCDEVFSSLNGCDSTPVTDFQIPVIFGRKLDVPQCTRDLSTACMFSFSDLCLTESGAADYRAIAEKFKVVVLTDVPVMTLANHNSSRRFITLIDELYEAGCCLVCR